MYPDILFYKLGENGSTQEIVTRQPASYIPSASCHDISDSHLTDRYDALRRDWIGPRTVAGKIIVQNRVGTQSSESIDLTHLGPEIDPTCREMNAFEDTGRIVFWTSHAHITRRSDRFSKNFTEDSDQAKFKYDILHGEDVKEFPVGTKLDLIVVSREPSKSWYVDARLGLDLLIINWSDTEENVARRIGHCTVYERDWVKLERTWRLVILE
jgi:hypothetical protein